MEIFVTGATGVLGRAAVPRLLEAGHRVRALARTEAQASAFRAAGVEPIVGSLFDDDTLARGVTGADAVMHLATRIPAAAKMRSRDGWRDNDRIRSEGTRRLVTAAREAGVTTFVYPSITLVYAGRGEDWIDAASGTIESAWTVATSLEAEAMVREFGEAGEAGRRGVILRMGVLYGPDNPATASFVAAARRGFSGVVGAADGYQSSIWADDAGAALVAALEAPGGTYDVVDDEPLTRRQIDGILAAAVGRRSLRRLPERAQRLLVGDGAPFLFTSQRVSNRRFRELTGWRPSVPSLRAGVPLVVAANPPTTTETARPEMSRVVTLALGFVAVLTLTLGAWQLFAPASFFFDFPGGGLAWVQTDGTYNEHLVRDLGGPTLALGVLAAWALLAPSRQLVRAVGLMTFIPGLPHFVYHLATIDLLPTVLDQALQTSTLALGLVAALVLLVAPLRARGSTSFEARPAVS